MSGLLGVADLEPERLRGMIELALAVKRDPEAHRESLSGRSVGLYFMKPSLRTWLSCDVAASQLGAHPVLIPEDQAGLGTREAVEDVARVLERYLDLIGMRVFGHGLLEEVESAASIPVVNLLSDREHPCQAVADLVTIEERVGLGGATVAYLGDGNNVCHSLMLGVAMTGGAIRVATPPGYRPRPDLVSLASRHGSVEVTEDPKQAVEGADVVYTDVWASMGQEDEAASRRTAFGPFRVDLDLFRRAAPGAVFMHCLPAHRGEEVTAEVLEHERSVVFDQAENRLHAFKAILLDLLR